MTLRSDQAIVLIRRCGDLVPWEAAPTGMASEVTAPLLPLFRMRSRPEVGNTRLGWTCCRAL